eukprot:15417160-Heterocapsa_arctica.AAC.1
MEHLLLFSGDVDAQFVFVFVRGMDVGLATGIKLNDIVAADGTLRLRRGRSLDRRSGRAHSGRGRS